ncbi:MAG TPA: hypothetical protein VJ865_11835 [Gemmatimonadaceae bacterium]|nr:hypothetical protein [Gemmatimonadaceae bacterium]
MDDFLAQPQVFPAIVALLGVLISVLVSVWIARRQFASRSVELDQKAHELQLRGQELAQAAKQLEARMEEYRQSQLQEILKARITAYPKLWNILVTYGRNWTISRKTRDLAWAQNFLAALNSCNAEIGVFFSEPVYAKFNEFRSRLITIELKLNSGESVPDDEYSQLFAVIVGNPPDGAPGLATRLKNDLGSYSPVAIQHDSAAAADQRAASQLLPR